MPAASKREVFYETQTNLQYVASGCVRTPATDLAGRIKSIYDGITEIIATYHPNVMAIEKVFMASNADSALKLGQARGAAITACVNQSLPVSEYTALQIKRAEVGKGKAGPSVSAYDKTWSQV